MYLGQILKSQISKKCTVCGPWSQLINGKTFNVIHFVLQEKALYDKQSAKYQDRFVLHLKRGSRMTRDTQNRETDILNWSLNCYLIRMCTFLPLHPISEFRPNISSFFSREDHKIIFNAWLLAMYKQTKIKKSIRLSVQGFRNF